MREKELLQIWNEQRSQRIHSQLAPTILLAATLALIATGKLTYKSSVDVKALAMGLVVGFLWYGIPIGAAFLAVTIRTWR